MIKKVRTFVTTQGWQFEIVVDDSIVIYADTHHFKEQRLAAQAGYRWINEDAHSRISLQNAVELP
jgi:hypothetical protein